MLFNCKNFNYFKWAIVLDWFWEKYLVKIIQNFTFKRGFTSY